MFMTRFMTRLRAMRQQRKGVVAVEFALVALPLIMLTTALIEIGIMLLTSVTLHGALEVAARKLRTGEVYLAGNETQQRTVFEEALCGELFLTSCDDVVYDVRSAGTYGTLSLPALALDSTSGLPSTPIFVPGDRGEITAARVYTRFQFITPFLEELFHDSSQGRLLAYAAVVKGEPW